MLEAAKDIFCGEVVVVKVIRLAVAGVGEMESEYTIFAHRLPIIVMSSAVPVIKF